MSRIEITQTGGTLSVDETAVAVVVVVGEQGPSGAGGGGDASAAMAAAVAAQATADAAYPKANLLSEIDTAPKKVTARGNLGVDASQTWADHHWQSTDMVSPAQAAPFGSSAVASGSTASPGASDYVAGTFGIARMRSSTTTGSGWRFNTSQPLRGQAGLAFRAVMGIFTGISGLVRAGFHDSVSVADATNGVYLEIADGVATLKASTNSVRTSSGSTYTLTTGVFYVIDIDFLTDTTAECKISALDGTLLATLSVASNVPNATNRTFNAGVIATRPGATVVDVAMVDYIGFGPVRPAIAKRWPA